MSINLVHCDDVHKKNRIRALVRNLRVQCAAVGHCAKIDASHICCCHASHERKCICCSQLPANFCPFSISLAFFLLVKWALEGAGGDDKSALLVVDRNQTLNRISLEGNAIIYHTCHMNSPSAHFFSHTDTNDGSIFSIRFQKCSELSQFKILPHLSKKAVKQNISFRSSILWLIVFLIKSCCAMPKPKNPDYFATARKFKFQIQYKGAVCCVAPTPAAATPTTSYRHQYLCLK